MHSRMLYTLIGLLGIGAAHFGAGYALATSAASHTDASSAASRAGNGRAGHKPADQRLPARAELEECMDDYQLRGVSRGVANEWCARAICARPDVVRVDRKSRGTTIELLDGATRFVRRGRLPSPITCKPPLEPYCINSAILRQEAKKRPYNFEYWCAFSGPPYTIGELYSPSINFR